MAKVTKPLMSEKARGAFARALIYQSTATTQTVKHYAAPHVNDSPATLKRKNQYRDAVRAWNSMSSTEQAIWANNAHGTALTGFNIYVATYMQAPIPLSATEWDNNETQWDNHTTLWDPY